MLTRIGLALAVVLLLWAAWWPVAAWREGRATESWLEARRDAGWQAEWAEVSLSGAPWAYIRTITAPALADPATGWAWQAERVTLARARHPQFTGEGMTITLPDAQEIRSPEQRIALGSTRLEAFIIFGADETMSRATLDAEQLTAVSDAGWRIALSDGRLTATATEGAPERLTLSLTATGLAPPARIVAALSRADIAPETIERLEAVADITFDRPWSVAALEDRRPQPTRIALENAALRWGELELRVAGTLEIDADGIPDGDLLVKATNWRELLAAARVSGGLPEGVADALEGTLELASRLAGSPQTLDIPVSFSNERTRLGPVPVGPAPVLRLP